MDLETFYRKHQRAIDMASAFVGSRWVRQLITSCRLKPYSYFTGDYKKNKLQRLWVDEFGGSVLLMRHNVRTRLNNEQLKYEPKSTDLFGRLPIADVLSKSRAVIASSEHFLCYGTDQYFRCFTTDGKIVSPIEVGAANVLNFLPFIGYREKYFEDEYALYALPNKEIETMIIRETSR